MSHTSTVHLSSSQARTLINEALVGVGTRPSNAQYLTDAILDTELSGLEGHGFFWLQFYCEHVVSGKVDGKAIPRVEPISATAFRIDAAGGFAHPAIEAGFECLIPSAKEYGVAAMGVYNSYNCGTLGYHTGVLAKAGLVALGAANAMPVMAPTGGHTPVLGTNPMSFAVPGEDGDIAFLIDQSSSAVAWTAVKKAADENLPIPLGWALDAQGQQTTDAQAGLDGSMAPAGGYKGFGQALMVEVLCAAVAGGNLAPEMGSFTDDDAQPIGCGQFFVALDPDKFSGGTFRSTINALTASILSQDGARLPNDRRAANKARLSIEGLDIDRRLFERLRAFA